MSLQLRDICSNFNSYIISICSTSKNLKDYEEKLLDKCFDHQYQAQDIPLGKTTMYYEPPFGIS